jgi:hypothetical protein
MAVTTVYTYDLNGSKKDFDVPFEYLARRFVQVTLIGQDRKPLDLASDFRFIGKTSIQTLKAWGPADGYERIEIRRNTSATDRLVDFADGSILRANELNTSQVQTLHVAEEARNMVVDTIGTNEDGDLDARGRRLVNLADASEPGHAVTLRQEREWAASTLSNRDRAEASAAASQAAKLASEAARDVSIAKAAEVFAGISSALDSAQASELSRLASERARDSATGKASESAASAAASQAAKLASEAARDVSIAKAADASAAAARINLPLLSPSDSGKMVFVNEAGTGYVLMEPPAGPLLNIRWVPHRDLVAIGELPLDGQLISRADYLQAIARIPAVMRITEAVWLAEPLKRGFFSEGNGSTTIRLPDYNGKSSGAVGTPFLRGDGKGTAGAPGVISMDTLQDHVHEMLHMSGYTSPEGWGRSSYRYIGTSGGTYASSLSMSAVSGQSTPNVRVSDQTKPIDLSGCYVIRLK